MMTQQLVLSLFPGIGLLDLAFEEQGFCIVRGPDLLWGGDIHNFHPPTGKFDGIIGGPPCQAHSRLAHIVKARGYKTTPDLIPEFARCVIKAQPDWYLMENVPGAPRPETPGYHINVLLLNNRACNGVQNRKRRFAFGTKTGAKLLHYLDVCLLEQPNTVPAVLASGTFPPNKKRLNKKNGPSWATVAHALEAQELPANFLERNKCPFTARGAQMMIGNGVPLPMGRTIARAVKRATEDMYGERPDSTALVPGLAPMMEP